MEGFPLGPLAVGVVAIVAGAFIFINRKRAAASSADAQARLGAVGRRTSRGSTPFVLGVFGICARSSDSYHRRELDFFRLPVSAVLRPRMVDTQRMQRVGSELDGGN